MGPKWAHYFPWTLPELPLRAPAHFGMVTLTIGLAGGCVVGLLGLADFLHRESV